MFIIKNKLKQSINYYIIILSLFFSLCFTINNSTKYSYEKKFKIIENIKVLTTKYDTIKLSDTCKTKTIIIFHKSPVCTGCIEVLSQHIKSIETSTDISKIIIYDVIPSVFIIKEKKHYTKDKFSGFSVFFNINSSINSKIVKTNLFNHFNIKKTPAIALINYEKKSLLFYEEKDIIHSSTSYIKLNNSFIESFNNFIKTK